MFPNAVRTAIPPLPPDIAAQAAAPPPASAMFSQMGMAIPDPVVVLEGKVAQLEQWASEVAPLTNQINPALTTLLVPIAQAGKALQSEIENLKQRTAGPSPQVMGSAPPTLPGSMPSARPAM